MVCQESVGKWFVFQSHGVWSPHLQEVCNFDTYILGFWAGYMILRQVWWNSKTIVSKNLVFPKVCHTILSTCQNLFRISNFDSTTPSTTTSRSQLNCSFSSKQPLMNYHKLSAIPKHPLVWKNVSSYLATQIFFCEMFHIPIILGKIHPIF